VNTLKAVEVYALNGCILWNLDLMSIEWFGAFCLVVGFELRASCLLDQGSDTHPPALFCFSYFLSKFLSFCPGLASDCDFPTYGLLYSWDMYHHARLV
jgi:hypothetical protein